MILKERKSISDLASSYLLRMATNKLTILGESDITLNDARPDIISLTLIKRNLRYLTQHEQQQHGLVQYALETAAELHDEIL